MAESEKTIDELKAELAAIERENIQNQLKAEKTKLEATKKQEEEALEEPVAKEGEESTAGQNLRETGAKLQSEYQALMEERKQLDKAVAGSLTPAARRELDEKIKESIFRHYSEKKKREAGD